MENAQPTGVRPGPPGSQSVRWAPKPVRNPPNHRLFGGVRQRGRGPARRLEGRTGTHIGKIRMSPNCKSRYPLAERCLRAGCPLATLLPSLCRTHLRPQRTQTGRMAPFGTRITEKPPPAGPVFRAFGAPQSPARQTFWDAVFCRRWPAVGGSSWCKRDPKTSRWRIVVARRRSGHSRIGWAETWKIHISVRKGRFGLKPSPGAARNRGEAA